MVALSVCIQSFAWPKYKLASLAFPLASHTLPLHHCSERMAQCEGIQPENIPLLPAHAPTRTRLIIFQQFSISISAYMRVMLIHFGSEISITQTHTCLHFAHSWVIHTLYTTLHCIAVITDTFWIGTHWCALIIQCYCMAHTVQQWRV